MKKSEPRWLRIFDKYTPRLVGSCGIQMLMNLTADAFGVDSSRIWIKRPAAALELYRDFTVNFLQAMEDDEREAVCIKLYDNAYSFGAKLGRLPGIRTDESRKNLVFWIYKMIGITLEGELPGNVRIPKCYFSNSYTPQFCEIMSYADCGIISGIYGGGKLIFNQRITERCGMCTAVFQRKNQL